MTRADWLSVVFAVALLPVLYWQLWQPGERGETAKILSGDRQVDIRELHGAGQFDVAGRLGDSVLQIENGKIRFIASPCTNKYCVHAGWLSHSGEIAACLPNGVLIEVQGGAPRYDAINF